MAADHPERQTVSLDGEWLFQTNGAPAKAWKPVSVPSNFESHEGSAFDGIGWYKRRLPELKAPAGSRILVHFQAVATEAEVWLNSTKLGTHLGGWTPFRFEITRALRDSPAGAVHELRIRVDEKVGHNTQGFLPIIQPHFGGIWQSVSLLVLPASFIDDLRLFAWGNPASGQIELDLPLDVPPSIHVQRLEVTVRQPERPPRHLAFDLSNASPFRRTETGWAGSIPVESPRLWSQHSPVLYEVELALLNGTGPPDRITTRAAFRTVRTEQRALLLNGVPLQVRGLLNWGYYPPDLAPLLHEQAFRNDLEFARARGFNLMKFCLWIPPKRFLELADEMGMLCWIEYPTWHPQLSPRFLPELEREFTEFFYLDRTHPAILLRSLTCETGPSADLNVIRSLYDRAHKLIPGALVEDDSSWIQWNRISDFYDDHPYGNNHTWKQTLLRLNDYIRAREPKPLLLGEAIAADTWTPPARLAAQHEDGTPLPQWFPAPFREQIAWLERMQTWIGPGGLAHLETDSRVYAMLMRKYQAEVFRREVPAGGYVISVIRDVPTASMGLLDYQGQSKWTELDWNWQGDTACLLTLPGDRRSFFASELFTATVDVTHFGPRPLRDATLTARSLSPDGREAFTLHNDSVSAARGSLTPALPVQFTFPSASQPERWVLSATLRDAQHVICSNSWSFWLMPAPLSAAPDERVFLHPSVPAALAHELFPDAISLQEAKPAGIIVASRFDDRLIAEIERGARVLFLPSGEKNSLPLRSHWFLRGAPYIPDHPLNREIPRGLWLELQHFDLAADILPEITYLEGLDPVLLLWDTHDRKTVATHGLVFETAIGPGRILVSALRHTGSGNAAGRWLLDRFVRHLAHGPEPRRQLPSSVWERAKQKLHEEKISLTEAAWKFRPDPENSGLESGWALPDCPEEAWKEIRAGRAWEAQGYPTLDGWAWYRLLVSVPPHWRGHPIYLSFEGVDDVYELYVDGKLAGKGGDLATKQDAFHEKKSHDLSRFLLPGASALIAVRVHDWFGAGGIFQPVSLGTTPLVTTGEMLK